MKKFNLILSGLMILFAAYFFFVGTNLDNKASQWPGLFAVILFFLSIALIIDTLRNPDRENNTEDESKNNESSFDKQMVYIILLLVGYLILMNYVGFLIMTSIFLIVTFMIINYGSLLKKISISVGTAVALTILFQYLLNVPIPQGILDGII